MKRQAGYQHGLEIDRIDNNGGYSPENCRWVTAKENTRNRRDNVPVTAFGETKLLTEWADDSRCAVNYNTLHQRIRRQGKPAEWSILTPSRRVLLGY